MPPFFYSETLIYPPKTKMCGWRNLPKFFLSNIMMERLISKNPSKHMHRHSVRFVLALSLVAVSLIQGGHSTASNEISSWSALTGSIHNMHAAMSSVKPSGNDDADFAALMLPHHQAAIDMAKWELINGKDPQMRRLAQEIITDQQSEIELMHLWLKQHPSHKQ
jgi:hypothetical protein